MKYDSSFTEPDTFLDFTTSLLFYSKQIPVIPQNKTQTFYQEIRNSIYNIHQSKWSLEKSLLYINKNKIDPGKFIDSLERLFNMYYKHPEKSKGKKTAFKFVETLKKSKKLNSLNYNFKGFKLNPEFDVIDFLHHMQEIHGYIDKDISQNLWITFIFENFKTGYTYNTLRRKYIDHKK